MLNIKNTKITVSIINTEDNVTQVCKGGMDGTCQQTVGLARDLPRATTSGASLLTAFLCKIHMTSLFQAGTRWDDLEWFPGDEWIPSHSLTDPNTQPKSPHYPAGSNSPSIHLLPNTQKRHTIFFFKWLRKASRSACLGKKHEKRKVQTELLSNPKQGGRQDKAGQSGEWGWGALHCSLMSHNRMAKPPSLCNVTVSLESLAIKNKKLRCLKRVMWLPKR